jgi:hypothetical protein
MNLGWATETASDAELKRVVLHEFGHAIGLHHEHLNPVGGIQWNKDAVYKDLMNPPNKWNKADVDDNLFEPLSKTQTNFTAFDPLSIMVYAISSKWTLDGYSVPETDALSDTDKKVVALYYPRQTLSEIDANCINPFDSSDAAVRGSGPYSVVNPACRGAMRKWVRDNGVGTAVIAQGFKPKTVGVGAITPDVTVTANYADLTALRGDCNRQDDWSVGSLNACVTAVQLYCQQRTGYYAGMAQSYDRATGQVEIACMSATFVNVTPTDVAARDSACDVRNAGPFGFHSSACLGVARDVCSEGGKNPNRVGILTSVAGDSVQMACVQANWFGEVRVTP